MAFNFIGVALMLPIFPLASRMIVWLVGDPAIPTIVNGVATYPLVPIAVGVYSIGFNIFNTAVLFPFIGTFERVLSRVGHSAADDIEDFSTPRFVGPSAARDLAHAVPAVRREIARLVWGAGLFLHMAQRRLGAPDDLDEHRFAIDVLSREIRNFSAGLFHPGMPDQQARLVTSLIAEADFAASLGEALGQTARRVLDEEFSDAGRDLANAVLQEMEVALDTLDPAPNQTPAAALPGLLGAIAALRERTLSLGGSSPPGERGALLALLGSAERVCQLVARIDVERRSVAGMSVEEPLEASPALPSGAIG